MTKIEYDEKRDRFYLTLYKESPYLCGLDPEHLEELCKESQDALYNRRELRDRRGLFP